jgi:chaperonin GroES
MKITPLFDKIVVEAVKAAETTASGIVLPGSAQDKPQLATVIAVGPGGNIDGTEVKMQVKVGDTILYSKYAGSDFKLENKEVTILRQSDVLAIVEK